MNIVSQPKWNAAIKLLTGQALSSEELDLLNPSEQRTVMCMRVGGAPLNVESANAALRRLEWSYPANENNFLVGDGTRQAWEEAVFQQATHFNVFRLHRRKAAGTFPQRECTVYATFPEAISDATPDEHALVYAVTEQGSNFCIPRSEWGQYTIVWFTKHGADYTQTEERIVAHMKEKEQDA